MIEKVKRKSLEKQLEWTKEKVRLLDEMDIRLREMRKIAVFAKENKLSSAEAVQMNGELNVLQSEYKSFEKQYNLILQ